MALETKWEVPDLKKKFSKGENESKPKSVYLKVAN